jgi:hypothetical protein
VTSANSTRKFERIWRGKGMCKKEIKKNEKAEGLKREGER